MKPNEHGVYVGESGVTTAGWHAVETYLRCPKAYEFSKVRGLHKPLAQTPDPFAVGSLVHAGRAAWFASAFTADWTEIERAMRVETEKAQLPMSPKAIAQAMHLMQAYIQHWDLRPRPTPKAVEYLVGPTPIIADGPVRTARLDDVSVYQEAGGRLCVGELKTTGDTVEDCVQEYTLHGQTLLQPLLFGLSDQGRLLGGEVAGVVLDVISKQGPTFGRIFLPVKQYALGWFARELAVQLKQAEAGHFPRNPKGCTYKAGRARVACEFRDLCAHGPSARSQFRKRNGELPTSEDAT